LLIRKAKTAGFCFGVDRAVNMVYDLLDKGETVYTLGPIIHNPQVIADLEKRGVVIIEHPEEVPECATVIVRTHGVPENIMEEFGKFGAGICDATCPYVKKIHKIVSEKSSPHIPVLIAGDEDHPEVRGIRSYCRGDVHTFKNAIELENILKTRPEYSELEIIIAAQTTFDIKEWQKCHNIIKKLCTKAIEFDTICNATRDRQSEAAELSRICDCMIIIGGRQSSNTAKLQSVCEPNCRTHLIETAEELQHIDFSNCDSVGVTAGASTPAVIIKEVLETMSELLNENTAEMEDTAAKTNTAEESAVMAALDGEPLTVDEIAARAAIAHAAVSATLTMLELKRLVRSLPGPRYARA